MAKPYEERFAAALKAGAGANTVQDMVSETEAMISDTRQACEAAQAVSLDPSSSDAEACQARETAERHLFAIDRLQAKRDRLEARHAEILGTDKAQSQVAMFRDAANENAALTAEMKERFPVLLAELVDFLTRLEADDARIAEANLVRPGGADPLISAELVARGANGHRWPPSLVDEVGRYTAMKVPRFDGHGLVWPIDHAGRARAQAEDAHHRALLAGRAAQTPKAIAARHQAEQDRWREYRVSRPAGGSGTIEGIRHRDGVGYVDHRAMQVWMDSRQVAAARAKGATVEAAARKVIQLTG